MLKPQVQLRLTEYDGLYDLIVGKNHLLRKIKDHIDFGFVNPMLRESYVDSSSTRTRTRSGAPPGTWP